MNNRQGRIIQERLIEKTKHTQEVVEKITEFYKQKDKQVNPQDVIKATTEILSNYTYSNEEYPSELKRLLVEKMSELDAEERVFTLGRLLDIFLYSSLVSK